MAYKKKVAIHYVIQPPKDVYLAFSGGVDSMVLFLSLLRKKHKVTLLFIDHQNGFSDVEHEFAKKISNQYNVPLKYVPIEPYTDTSLSREAYWSRKRFDVFQQQDKPVVVGHHLDDAVEWYVMSSMQGCSKLLDPITGNVIRPMLTNKKVDIIIYANAYNIPYITDPSNSQPSYCLRNKVRHELIGSIKNCFPGIQTTVKRLILEKLKRTQQHNDEENEK